MLDRIGGAWTWAPLEELIYLFQRGGLSGYYCGDDLPLPWLWAVAVVGEFGDCKLLSQHRCSHASAKQVSCSATGWESQSCALQQLLSQCAPCQLNWCGEVCVAYLLPTYPVCWGVAVGDLRLPFCDCVHGCRRSPSTCLFVAGWAELQVTVLLSRADSDPALQLSCNQQQSKLWHSYTLWWFAVSPSVTLGKTWILPMSPRHGSPPGTPESLGRDLAACELRHYCHCKCAGLK